MSMEQRQSTLQKGLNQMTITDVFGTRYCANITVPYKVRRFTGLSTMNNKDLLESMVAQNDDLR